MSLDKIFNDRETCNCLFSYIKNIYLAVQDCRAKPPHAMQAIP
jgi:hypothetical protein